MTFDSEITNKHDRKLLAEELYRLNKTGVINDEEFVILRKIVSARAVKPETYRQFDRLFTETAPPAGASGIAKIKTSEPDEKNESSNESTAEIIELAAQIVLLQQKMSDAGIFDHSRELLACANCSLMEDVTFDGRLITCHIKRPGVDTGLNFDADEQSGDWICPACGARCSEENL